MGAGCWYTHKTNPDLKVAWVDASCDCDDCCDCAEFIREEVEHTLNRMFGRNDGKRWYAGKLYTVNLEPTYNGDGILLYYENYCEPQISERERKLYPLAHRNHEASYWKFLKRFHQESELPLRIAYSAWTSAPISWSE